MGQEVGFWGDVTGRLRTALKTSLFRNSFFLMVRSGVNALLGLAFWLVVARYYAPVFVGIAAALLSLSLLLARGAGLGLPQGLLRFLPAASDRNGLLNAALTVSACVSLGIGFAFLAGLDLWAPDVAFIRSDLLLLVALLTSLVFFTLDGIVDNAFVSARRADYGLVRTTIFYGLRLVIAVGLASWGLLGIVSSWTISLVVSVLGVAVLLPRFFPGFRPRPAFRPLRRTGIIGFSLWSYGTGIVAGASSALLPLLILNRLGGDEGAIASAQFFAAYAIASLLYTIPQSFSTSLLVEGSYEPMNLSAERRKAVRYSGPLLSLGIAVAILAGPWLLDLFGKSYQEGYRALVLMALASPVILVTGIFAADLQVGKRAKPIFFVTCLSTTVTFVLATVALPISGTLGVGVAFVAGQVTKLLMYFLVRQRRIRMRGPSFPA